jgi:shikimate dehydrogenase
VRCGVLGDPIAHSLSPALHRAAYAVVGLDWEYDAHRVPAGRLAEFVDGLDASWRGLSVTAPLKREAAERASSASATVGLAGVANTLVHDDGHWLADNTDVPGAVAAVRERWRGEVTAGTVLGGGATAVSTGLALAELGARSVRLLVRDPARAASAVAALRRHPAAPQVQVASLHDDDVIGEVVVSTIPAAAQAAGLVARCTGVPVVFDVVYHPWPTPLAASVVAAGAADRILVSGLDLLVHQAALQLSLFAPGTVSAGATAPVVAAMRSAPEVAALAASP